MTAEFDWMMIAIRLHKALERERETSAALCERMLMLEARVEKLTQNTGRPTEVDTKELARRYSELSREDNPDTKRKRTRSEITTKLLGELTDKGINIKRPRLNQILRQIRPWQAAETAKVKGSFRVQLEVPTDDLGK